MISNTIEHNQKAESYSLIQAKNIILNDTELQTIAKEKLQPIITERFGGYGVSVNKVKEPKEAVPRIYVIEEYQTASYLGSYGAGKAMQTLSLMPGESTTITVKTYKDSTTTKHSAENLLDSMSQSSAAEMESLIEEENEQAYVVTTDGTISKLITGTDGIVDTDGVIDELKAKKLTPAFDIHTHPIIIKEDTDGIVKEFVGHAFPSIQDRKDTKIQEDKGSISQPNWVLGFFKYVSKYEKRFERRINFYTSSWEAIREKDIYPPPEKNAETYTESDQGMNFLKFKKAVKDIWKYVLPLIFLLFSVNSYSQFPRSVKSYIDVYYKYKDVLDKQDTLKIVEFPLFKECAKHGYFCFSSVRMHQYVKTNRNTIICRVASIRL
ncbi:MAG: hypothetical protein CSA89_00675 [Bacteroidales bacterium]|nr:MAG: hypothetical protein CSA89_00675 [Bacteroidales bacterium]